MEIDNLEIQENLLWKQILKIPLDDPEGYEINLEMHVSSLKSLTYQLLKIIFATYNLKIAALLSVIIRCSVFFNLIMLGAPSFSRSSLCHQSLYFDLYSAK